VQDGLAHNGRDGVREHQRIAERRCKVDGDRRGSAIAACDQRVRLVGDQKLELVGL
jgi:hypothetical protein